MSLPVIPDLLDRLTTTVHDLVASRFGEDSCILAVRVLQQAVLPWGWDCRVLACDAAIFNEPAWHLWNDLGVNYNSPYGRDRWQTAGAWSVGIGFGAEPTQTRGRRGWTHHLVAVIQQRWLADATLKQAERPNLGLTNPNAVIMEVDHGFIRGHHPALALVPATGHRLIYFPLPHDKSYKDAPDWQSKLAVAELATEARRRAKPRTVSDVLQTVATRHDPILR